MALTVSMFPSEMVKGRGKIEVILGPMFSGKTTELIRRITRYQFANFKCLVLKYANDVRYSETEVATHDSRTLSALSCVSLQDYKSRALGFDVLGIDEGQFFPDIKEFCEELANKGKIVVVAALDGTYQRVGFGDILNLVPLAESVIKLHAVCMKCYSNASFTKRISNEKAIEIIGGADKYMSVCRECYHLPEPSRNGIKRSPLKALNENETSPLKELNGKKFSPKKIPKIENWS